MNPRLPERPEADGRAGASPGRLSARAFVVGLVIIAAVFLGQAFYLARVLVPSHDETLTLFFGHLAASGKIGMYDDDVIGHRAPLPFYVLGYAQVLFGRSLFVGRLTAIGLGILMLLLTAYLARRLGGELCGLLAAAFLTAQGVLVAYYSIAEFHSQVALVITAGVLVWVAGTTARHNVVGTAIVGALFFVRTHVMPLVPFALAYGLWRARSRWERLAIVAVTVLPPLAFFLSDTRRLKLLANVSVVNRFVRRLGYVGPLVLDARPQESFASQAWWLIYLTRRYEFLLLAVAVAVGLVAWRLLADRRGARHYRPPSGLYLVAAVFGYLLAFQFILFRINFKWIGKYAASFAPLLMVLLGFAYSRLLTDPGLSRRFRRGLGVLLVAILALPIYYNRNSVLPIGEMRRADPYQAAHVAAAHLARAVPKEARIFFFGTSEVYYLSGLPGTYLPQVYSYNQLAVYDEDNRATVRSGAYGMPQLERWLGAEADYAVISPEALKGYAGLHPDANPQKVARIRALLAEHFEPVDRIAEFPYYSYDVYRRRR